MPLPEPCPFRGRLLFGFGSRYNLNHAICESRRDPGNKNPLVESGLECAPAHVPDPTRGSFCRREPFQSAMTYTHKILFFWSNVKFFFSVGKSNLFHAPQEA